MTAEAPKDINQVLTFAISSAIEAEMAKEVAKAVEDAKTRLDQRIPEIVSGVALRVMENVRFDRMRNEIAIYMKVGE